METTTAQQTTFLTQSEVAEMLHHTTTATLRWWRHQDRGPRSMKVGKRVLYKLVDVHEWLAAQESATARGGIK